MGQTLATGERTRRFDLSTEEVEFTRKCILFWRNWTPLPDCEGFLLYEKLDRLFSRSAGVQAGGYQKGSSSRYAP